MNSIVSVHFQLASTRPYFSRCKLGHAQFLETRPVSKRFLSVSREVLFILLRRTLNFAMLFLYT